MLAANISNVIENFDETCESVVQNCEPLIVTRNNNNNVVILSQAAYDNLLENIYIRKSSANYERLLKSIDSANQGHLTTLKNN